jgi:hypothetical protein
LVWSDKVQKKSLSGKKQDSIFVPNNPSKHIDDNDLAEKYHKRIAVAVLYDTCAGAIAMAG